MTQSSTYLYLLCLLPFLCFLLKKYLIKSSSKQRDSLELEITSICVYHRHCHKTELPAFLLPLSPLKLYTFLALMTQIISYYIFSFFCCKISNHFSTGIRFISTIHTLFPTTRTHINIVASQMAYFHDIEFVVILNFDAKSRVFLFLGLKSKQKKVETSCFSNIFRRQI